MEFPQGDVYNSIICPLKTFGQNALAMVYNPTFPDEIRANLYTLENDHVSFKQYVTRFLIDESTNIKLFCNNIVQQDMYAIIKMKDNKDAHLIDITSG